MRFERHYSWRDKSSPKFHRLWTLVIRGRWSIQRRAAVASWKLSDLKPFEKWPTVSLKIFKVRVVSSRLYERSTPVSSSLALFSSALARSLLSLSPYCLFSSTHSCYIFLSLFSLSLWAGIRRKVGALRVRQDNGNLHRTLGSRRAVTHTCPRRGGHRRHREKRRWR